MTENAGERLFQAMGQIPDEMVLEAAKEHMQLKEASGQDVYHPDADRIPKEGTDFKIDTGSRVPCRKLVMEKLGGYFKYLPVAACLCIVLGSAGYIMNNYIHKDAFNSLNHSSGFGIGADQKSADQEGAADDSGADMAMDEDVQEEGAAEQDRVLTEQKAMRPVRYDTYEGPVFPLTATGDIQKLKVSRSLKGVADTRNEEDGSYSLLKIEDVYQIKNTSKHDKTLQIVYPFSTVLNDSYAPDGAILQVTGEDSTPIAYSIGESILAYRNAHMEEQTFIEEQTFMEQKTFMEQQTFVEEQAFMETYLEIFDEQTDYQEQALAKEADWNKNVHVYTFTNTGMQEEPANGTKQGVIGVTVKEAGADVLTYGFDHFFTKEDGSTTYCFFASEEPKKIMLIVTGDQSARPQTGYYANLDCEEEIEGLQYDMSSQEMSYTDALRLCGNDAARKMSKDYERGMYAAKLPVYMNEDAAYRVLTMMSEEDLFYDTLMRRYQSSELTGIFDRLFAETRVIYARTTVTIPAKQSVQVTARTQKCQKETNDLLAEEQEHDGDISYDFLSSTQSRLPMAKTSVLLRVKEPWRITEQNMGLKKENKRTWKARSLNEAGSVTVSAAGAHSDLVLNPEH